MGIVSVCFEETKPVLMVSDVLLALLSRTAAGEEIEVEVLVVGVAVAALSKEPSLFSFFASSLVFWSIIRNTFKQMHTASARTVVIFDANAPRTHLVQMACCWN